MSNIYNPSDSMLSNYTEYDGTIRFYTRVSTIIKKKHNVLDLGAGRGRWLHDDPCKLRRELRDIKNKASKFIAADVDPEVLKNQTSHRNLIIKNNIIPIDSDSIDIVIADYVLEHVENPEIFKDEINRVLKVGGYFCARTPHKYEYISIIARLVHNKNHYRFIKIAQPDRKMEDTFNTCYKMNTLSTVRRLFYNYKDYSYLQSADPNYFFGKKWLYNLILFAHRFLPRVFYSNMFIFMKKIN